MAVSRHRPTIKQEHTNITLQMCVGERPCSHRDTPPSILNRLRNYSRDLYCYTLSTFHEKEHDLKLPESQDTTNSDELTHVISQDSEKSQDSQPAEMDHTPFK